MQGALVTKMCAEHKDSTKDTAVQALTVTRFRKVGAAPHSLQNINLVCLWLLMSLCLLAPVHFLQGWPLG